MATKINYQNINYDDLLSDLKVFLQSKNNFTDADFEGSNISLLLELMAYASSLMNYYINASANESYIATAELYESVNRLAELIGYFPQGFESSIVDTTMTLDLDDSLTATPWTSADVLGGNWFVEIPAYSEWKGKDNTSDSEIVLYTNPRSAGLLLTEEKYLAGTLEIVVPLIQGVPKSKEHTSDGSAFQKIEIDNPFIDHENIKVYVGSTEWTRKDNFYDDITATSESFISRVNQDSKVQLEFGDDLFGKIPPTGQTITIIYVESLGSKGKVAVNQLGSSTYNGFQTDVYVFNQFNTGQQFLAVWDVAQTSTSTYGADIETVEKIKNHAPWSFRTQGRVVTAADYQDFLKTNYSNLIVDVKAYNYGDAVDADLIPATEINYFSSRVDQSSGWDSSDASFSMTPSTSATSGEIAILAENTLSGYNRDGSDFTFTDWAKFDSTATSGGNYTDIVALPNSYHYDEAVYVLRAKIYGTSGISSDFKFIVDGDQYPVNYKNFNTISPSTSGAYSDNAYVTASSFICPISGTGTDMAGTAGEYGLYIPPDQTLFVDDLEIYQPIETSRYWFNNIFLYIVPASTTIIDSDGDIVDQATIDKFEADLLSYKMTTVEHVWKEPDYITFNITAVYSKDPTLIFTSSEVISNEVSQTISNYFDKSNRIIGDTISYSALIAELKTIEGILSVRLAITTSPVLPGVILTGDIELSDTQFPILGTTSISEGGV